MYNSYIVVGVPAEKVIKYNLYYRDQDRYNVYTGEKSTIKIHVYEFSFMGVISDDLYDIKRKLEEFGLGLFIFDDDSLGFYKHDCIGIRVCDLSSEGGKKQITNLSELAIKITECRQKLLSIGIDENPEIFLTMHLSY